MKYWEDYYIEYYDARNPKKGYNIIKGGQESPFQELWKNPDFKEKISKQQSELMKERLKNNPQEKKRLRTISLKFWEEHPEKREEFSQRMSERLKEQWQDEEYREQRVQDMKNLWNSDKREILIDNCKKNAINNWKNPDYRKKMCKGVINIESGRYFESGAAAARWCGIDRSSITKALKGTGRAGRHPETGEPLHWRYATAEEVRCS